MACCKDTFNIVRNNNAETGSAFPFWLIIEGKFHFLETGQDYFSEVD